MSVTPNNANGGTISPSDPFDISTTTPTAVTPRTQVAQDHWAPLSWTDLTYTVKVKKPDEDVMIDRVILNSLSGVALPGRTLAIMGGSGAGKTTLLSAISQRLRVGPGAQLDGSVQVLDIAERDYFRKLIAFVPQDDIVSTHATPLESLRFSLRVRTGVDNEEADRRTAQALQELGLEGCKNTMAGIPGLTRGLSGGERKRCSIGQELITDPLVLLLDEPTSGLDSVSADKICGLLRDLARSGRTVVFTIHSPNADTVLNFDDLLLLVEGHAVYHGPTADALDYFSSIGFTCPSNFTPTDYYMQVIQEMDNKDRLILSWREYVAAHRSDPRYNPMPVCAKAKESKHYDKVRVHLEDRGAPLAVQFQELMTRSAQAAIRNTVYILTMFVQCIFFGIFCGLLYFRVKRTQEGVMDAIGVIFMVLINKAFSGAMSVINTFPAERAVYIREQQAASYSPLLYFISKSVAELPVQVLACLVETVIIYWMADLRHDGGAFWVFFACSFMIFQISIGIGLALGAAIKEMEIAANMPPLVILPLMLTGGLFASYDRMHPYWVWLEKVSFIKYGFVIMMKNEFKGPYDIACSLAKYGSDCAKMYKTAEDVLRDQQLLKDEYQVWIMWVCLAALLIVFRSLAVWALFKVARNA